MRDLDETTGPGQNRGNAETRTAPLDSTRPARIAVVYATRGRPDVLSRVVADLAQQRLQPVSIIVSCTVPEDAGVLSERPDVTVLLGSPGLAAQRNTALRHLGSGVDLIVFFDDDFVADPAWLAAAARAFASDPKIGAVTGAVIADDIKGPGLSFPEAQSLIAAHRPAAIPWVENGVVPYGCNMAFRLSAVAGLSFDERLIRYGWLEDRDFGATVVQRGYRSVKISGATGVHMGVKRARMPGRMLGYSQVVNPFYMRAKGTMSTAEVMRHIGRNLASNLVRSIAPEPYIDRRGRLRGNLDGFVDVVRGHLDPERADRS